MPVLKYYTFKLGAPRTPMSTWKDAGVRVPAQDPRMAICMNEIAHSYIRRHSYRGGINKHIHFEPTKYDWYFPYRQVIEWEFIKRKSHGQFLMQFKKVKTYSQYEIEKMFSKEYKTWWFPALGENFKK